MIEFEVIGSLGVITLNRLNALNALTLEMLQSMIETLDAWKLDKRLQTVVIQSASPKVFCAGGDIRAVYQNRDKPVDALLVFFKDEYENILKLKEYPKPIISLMNGVTMGGGVGLGMHVRFPIAGEDMVFAMPETAIGLFPDVGASFILNQLKNAWKYYIALFGARLFVQEICALGLAKAHIHTSHWNVLKKELAQIKGEDAFVQVQTIVNQYKENIPPIELPDPNFDIFDAPTLGVLIQRLSQETSLFFQELKDKLSHLSPLSMVMTFKQMQDMHGKTIQECLKLDILLMRHFLLHSDFFEGVRALLIDKDKKPKWTYQHIDEVQKELVELFFQESIDM